MDTHIHASTHGTILYDAASVPQIDHAWFDPDHWQGCGRLRGRGGGRASACFVDSPAGECVLRHYHRGGMVANVLGDRYLWTGRDNTRSFAEFRLLVRLCELDLPVPLPLAARYVRRGIHYTADLITRRIEHSRTLAECLHEECLDATLAQTCGVLIARFHGHGVWHADLNAHNILVTDQVNYIIDFDRGQLRTPARAWQQSNLARLRRSLIKLGAARDGEDVFEKQVWLPLMRGYTQTMEKPRT
ncbi:MAG TPA: 3-deoxy-D-manno-octulosonic acid kinase [Oleiagrimonas sp.]|nr:3-deoxy-D-manno-octulosonic acid kinase [Oleiagrimonas sp.]